MSAAQADVWNFAYGLDEGVLCNCPKHERTQNTLRLPTLCLLTQVRIGKWTTNVWRITGGGCVRRVEWMVLYSWSLPAKKEKGFKHSKERGKNTGLEALLIVANVVVSEASKQQPCSWKRESQLFSLYWCSAIVCASMDFWTHTLDGIGGLAWTKNKPLPRKKEKFWQCLDHRIAVWIPGPVYTSVNAAVGQGWAIWSKRAQDCFWLLQCFKHKCDGMLSLQYCSPLQDKS